VKTLLSAAVAACLVALPVLVLAFAPAPDAGGKPVEYKTYNGYAESRDSGLKGGDSFLALTARNEFARTFDPVVTPRGLPDPVARADFDSRLFVAVIKRGDVLWDYKVEKVTANGDTLTVYYRATAHKAVEAPRGEMKMETRKEAFATARAETRKAPADTKKAELPAETRKEVAKETKKEERPKETAKESPKETAAERPRGTAKELPKATAKWADTKKEYGTARERPSSTTFDSPLILSVPKDKYASVIFIENGRKAGSARVGN
jgi:hypothetical protein